ncbi:MAG: hypothetical protein KA152_00040 [Verrucomicrobiales bacterium]|jgi:hypothetical protein|nr:hypothetical protein [Verrucomicrobiales bacterium]MBP9222485.1 hypothetical protein [Verrucomicrobiales bacterium]
METLFTKYDLSGTLRNQPKGIRDEIEKLDENYLLNVSEDDLGAALAPKFLWDPPVLGEPQIASHKEVFQEVTEMDDRFLARGESYQVRLTRIIVHVPYVGDTSFFRMLPPQSHWTPPRASIQSNYLEIVYDVDPKKGIHIRESIEKFVSDVRYHLDQITKVSHEHNATLPQHIRTEIQARKARILDRRDLVASIGIPLRNRDDSPKTYAVPSIRKKPEVKLPQASHTPFVPEPVLDEKEYENILTIMRSMVRVMEASPHAFSTMKEEDLRQHFLVQLNGQYQGGATGETFNYEGKTDILIREKERNVFVGECKFWKGPESLKSTIDQCLGYLHWRDTKAAIVMFNRNKDFTNVLAQIEPTAKVHPAFKRFVRQAGETEWRFIFSNKDDSNREVHLAIMAFDIPKAP